MKQRPLYMFKRVVGRPRKDVGTSGRRDLTSIVVVAEALTDAADAVAVEGNVAEPEPGEEDGATAVVVADADRAWAALMLLRAGWALRRAGFMWRRVVPMLPLVFWLPVGPRGASPFFAET